MRSRGPKVEKNKTRSSCCCWCWCWCCLFLLLKRMLPLVPIAVCCWLWWDSGGGTAVTPATSAIAWLPSLPMPGTLLFIYSSFFFMSFSSPSHCTSPPPHSIWRRRLQDFVYIQLKHTKIIMGREYTFFSGRGVFFRRKFSRIHSLVVL